MIALYDYYKLYWPLLEQENCLTKVVFFGKNVFKYPATLYYASVRPSANITITIYSSLQTSK